MTTTTDRSLWVDDLLKLNPGARVILAHMGNDPDPVPTGTVGTVRNVTDITGISGTTNETCVQVVVDWDNGRHLSCICPPDVLIPYPENPEPESAHDIRWRPH